MRTNYCHRFRPLHRPRRTPKCLSTRRCSHHNRTSRPGALDRRRDCGRSDRGDLSVQRALRDVQHVAASERAGRRDHRRRPRLAAQARVRQHHRRRAVPARRHRRHRRRRRDEGQARRRQHERLLHRPRRRSREAASRSSGVRVSLEGLPAANDELRGLRDGFDHGLRTLLQLRARGVKDIGFGITLCDRNADDLLRALRAGRRHGRGVRHGSRPQRLLLPQVRQRVRASPNASAGKLEELAGHLLRTRTTQELVPRLVQHGAGQLRPRRRPPAAVRRGRRSVLRRPVRRGAALQRHGGDDGLAEASSPSRRSGRARSAAGQGQVSARATATAG